MYTTDRIMTFWNIGQTNMAQLLWDFRMSYAQTVDSDSGSWKRFKVATLQYQKARMQESQLSVTNQYIWEFALLVEGFSSEKAAAPDWSNRSAPE